MSSEEVRRAVRESWGRRFDKRRAANSEQEEDEAQDAKRQKNEVIEIVSDEEADGTEVVEVVSDGEVQEVQEANPATRHIPPFLPIHNPLYDDPKLPNSVQIQDVLSSPNLRSCYIFSFQHDLNFILPKFDSSDIDLTIVYQTGTVIDSPLRPLFKNVQLIEISMQPYTSHHPKLIINIYKDNTVQLFLVSANMTYMEWNTNNQMIWKSPFLHENKNAKDTVFKTHLFNYLKNYNKPQLNTLVVLLKNYDFNEIKGDFVSSATSSSDKFGYLGLYNSLLSRGLIPRKHERQRQLLYQTSSIASAIRFTDSTSQSANIFTHLLLPLFSGKYNNHGKLDMKKDFPLPNGYSSIENFKYHYKVKPYIIFPSLSDVRNSLFGYSSGGWSHYNPHSKWNKPMNSYLQPNIFHHSHTNQRKTNSSHTKFLIMSSDEFKTLDWVFFTSTNMSKQAWGTAPTKRELSNSTPKANVSNYETGILLSPDDYGPGVKFVPLEIGEKKELGEDEVPIYLPFKLPPEKYSEQDEPWCISQKCDLPDILGDIHNV